MISAHCASCARVTGHKRALGWGTFFAVLLTAGLWLLAIPFYQKRCMICGGLRGVEATHHQPSPYALHARYRARVTLWVMGTIIAVILMLAWLAPKYPR
jgi:hypothetical protein